MGLYFVLCSKHSHDSHQSRLHGYIATPDLQVGRRARLPIISGKIHQLKLYVSSTMINNVHYHLPP